MKPCGALFNGLKILMADLHFVFLQGLPSPFFKRVGRELTQLGCRVTGINLCVGDQIFWRGANTINYRGRLDDWGSFLLGFYETKGVTDIVLLGEQRSYHKIAIELAHSHGIRVTAIDFGYLRPDWITVERDGMGGASHFPKDPATITALAVSAPVANLAQRYTDGFWTMAWGDMHYHFSNLFYFWLFPHYCRPYKRDPPFTHYFSIGKRLLLAKKGHQVAMKRLADLKAEQTPYFLLPLQLENDFQIVSYSPFSGQKEALWLILRSFAAHAPVQARLLIKVHPWDPGVENWQQFIEEVANELGIGSRLDYFDGGNLDDIIVASQGVVTINSTVGLRALQLDRPVMVLGEAIYHIVGLTFQESVDEFWTRSQKPDPVLREAFIKVLCHYFQIRGTFYSEPGLSAAVKEMADRLYSGRVGVESLG